MTSQERFFDNAGSAIDRHDALSRHIVLGDEFSMEVTERRPWWAFWRKDKRVLRTYRVTATATSR